jgi:deoxyribodipyrimidine photolyase-related protein
LEVIQKVEKAYKEKQISLASIEGFIRQVLGWREYIRGVYWAYMPGYDQQNYFSSSRKLPNWFWTGKTKMNCLKHSIHQSLHDAYAHHIQRLMVVGNFSLLASIDPKEIHAWYLGIYIDAFEWVELPNTLGMSQFADGGILASKPYVSSGSYIDKMSNYCKNCHYKVKDKLGENACPFNSLYWSFMARHQSLLSNNQRLGITYNQLKKMDPIQKDAILHQAELHLNNIDNL